MGGKFHLKLNIGSRPIANKYHEGKVKRTLKRELKVPEIAEREANGTSFAWRDCSLRWCRLARVTQVSWFALIRLHGVVLALCVSAGAHLMKTAGTRYFFPGRMNVLVGNHVCTGYGVPLLVSHKIDD